MKKVKYFIALLTSLCIVLSTVSITTVSAASSDERVNFIQAYVDRILENSEAYDLLPNGFNVYSNTPVTWVAKDGTVTTPSSIMSHQYFFRLLNGLSELTGDSKYLDYAKSQFTQYMSDENLHDSNGLFYAGNHRYYDLNTGEIFGSVTNSYEHKYNFPYYDLMFETNPEKSADFIEAYWNAMVSDWEKLLFSRHGGFNKEIADDVWANAYDKDHDLWLANSDAGLSFINAGTDLIYSGVKYYQQTGNLNALTWAKRLWNEYYQVSDQTTKILVYQYTKLDSGDRGLAQFASSGYGDRALEGKVLTRGIASSIYGIAVPVMVQLAVELEDEEWLSQLKASYEGFIDYAYNSQTKQFKPILSDGTDLTGYVADVDGYFFDKGETLTEYAFTTDMKTGLLYVAAMTGSEKLWSVASSNYTSLGDIGSEPGINVALNLNTNTANAQYALSFLYLYDKTGVNDYLNMALRICDNMKTYSYSNGYYLKESANANNNEYINASVNTLAPLVTLKAAAYALGKPEAVPDFPVSTGGFLDDFSGETGKRTTDQDFTFKQKKSDTTSKVVNLLTNELYYLPTSINGHPVTWADGAAVVDTTQTGTYTYYGTSPDNLTCILIVNVSGYSYYEDFQTGRTPNTTPGSSGTDIFRIDSSDTSEAIKYMYTDSENMNIALSFDCSTAARSAFVPFSETYSGNGVEVGFKLKVDLGTATTGYMRVRTVSSEGNSLETRLHKNSDGTYTVNHFNGLTKISNADTSCSTEWVAFKYVFNLPEKTYDVYINDTKVNQTSYTCQYDTITQLHISGRTAGITGYIDDVYMKNSLSSNAEGVLTLKLDTEDLSFDVLQGETVSAQEISYNIINSDGEDTGLNITKSIDMDIDTSYVGTFNRELDVDGQTVPYTVTVSKLSQLVYENFQEYEDDVVATEPRPYYSPYNSEKSPATDQVIFDTDGNKVGAINEDGNRKWTRFNTGATSAGGKFSFSYKLKIDEAAKTSDFSQFTVAIANTDNETNFLAMHFIKDNTTGALSFKAGDKTIYPELSYGGWIRVSGIVDIDNHTYNVVCNNEEASGELANTIISGAAEFRFGDRTSATSYSAQHLIDDIELNSYLKVSSIKQAQATVYLGDEAQLPETVETVLSDGISVSSLPVIWNGSVSANTIGTQELTGSVPGAASYTPSLSVTITDLPYMSGGILVHNKDGYTIMNLADGATIKGITLEKISQSTYDSKIYIGVFHKASGKLMQSKTCKIDAANISWEKGESKYFDIDLQLDLPDGIDATDCTAQAFVLADTLKPLALNTALSETINSATIWLAGDSITCEYAEGQKPETGWGEKLAEQLNNVTVYNEALGGQSTKSFYDQNRLQKILVNSNPGDYLFIMFGINDDKDEEYRHTEPGTTYNEYLKKFITEAREYGMIPILLTSSERFTAFKSDGSVASTMGEYPEATRTVAKEENVPLIDVHSKILTDMTKQGKANYQKYYMVFDAGVYENYPNGSSDTTHLRPEGAELITSFVMEGIKELNLPLAALCVQ